MGSAQIIKSELDVLNPPPHETGRNWASITRPRKVDPLEIEEPYLLEFSEEGGTDNMDEYEFYYC